MDLYDTPLQVYGPPMHFTLVSCLNDDRWIIIIFLKFFPSEGFTNVLLSLVKFVTISCKVLLFRRPPHLREAISCNA